MSCISVCLIIIMIIFFVDVVSFCSFLTSSRAVFIKDYKTETREREDGGSELSLCLLLLKDEVIS